LGKTETDEAKKTEAADRLALFNRMKDELDKT
jgi:hypothetical protein